MSKLAELVSRVVSLRSAQFQAIEDAENEAGFELDDRELEAVIDTDYAGRESVTEDEARHIVIRASSGRLQVVK